MNGEASELSYAQAEIDRLRKAKRELEARVQRLEELLSQYRDSARKAEAVIDEAIEAFHRTK